MVSDLARRLAKETLYLVSPSAWCRRELKLVLDGWQSQMVDAPAGSRVIALVHRQAGKTTAGALGCAHTMTRRWPGSTSLALAPTQRQSAELILKVRTALIDSGERLAVDNAFLVALNNGSRCLALPGADDAAIRGLSIDGDLVVDEAARVADALYEAARPMMIRHAATARLILLSTAWAKLGFFYKTWTDGDPQDWTKIEARVEECRHISAADLEHIFERFYRADSSRARDTGGFGLGLSIARELLEAMGGSLSATSQPGLGSTFWISLRRADSAK